MNHQIKINGENISYIYEQDSHKYTLLFIHGFASSKAIIRGLIKFKNRNYNIIAFDCPGFGTSKTEKPQKVEFYQAITNEFIKKVVPNNTVVMGHSLGSLSAIAVEDNPKIKNIILMSSINPWYTSKDYQELIKLLLPKDILSASKALSFITENKEKYGKAFDTIAEYFLSSEPRNRKLFYDLLTSQSLNPQYLETKVKPLFLNQKKKLLFIHGQKDKMIPIEGIRIMVKKLNTSLFEIPNIGHSPIFECPKIVNDYLINHFNLLN